MGITGRRPGRAGLARAGVTVAAVVSSRRASGAGALVSIAAATLLIGCSVWATGAIATRVVAIVSATARVTVGILVVGHVRPILLPGGRGPPVARLDWLPHAESRYLLASLNSRRKPENMPFVLPSCSPTACATFAPLSADVEEDATPFPAGAALSTAVPAASS